MKKVIGLALGLIIILLLSMSCGIPQEKYDKATSDLATAQSQAQTLQGDLTAAQSQAQTLKGDLAAKDTQLKTASDKLAKAKSEIEVLNAIFIPSLTGEFNQMTEGEAANFLLEWRDKIIAIGDSELTAKFQALIDSGGSNNATIAFFIYLLEDVAKTLK